MSPQPDPHRVVVRPLTPGDAEAVTRWRYEGPWSVYDGKESERISAELGYHAVEERPGGRFLGFFCLGPDARVAGLAEEPGVLDFGVGLDPAVVGKGRGAAIFGPVLEWVSERSDAHHLRAVVQAWNGRSLRFCQALGFEIAGHHLAPVGNGGVEYVVLRRAMPSTGASS